MSTFADSSALVKLYAAEADSEQVEPLTALVVAQIARVEVPAAIWRKQRMGELTAADAGILVAAFEADYYGTPDDPPRFAVLRTTAGMLDSAARYTATHGLRAYDAVQLAGACAARAVDAGCDTFAAFDIALRTAAAAEGFRLIPET